MVAFLTTGWWGITETIYVPAANHNTIIFHDEGNKHHLLSVVEWLTFLGLAI